MPIIKFWDLGIHPVTGYRLNWNGPAGRSIQTPIIYVKTEDFSTDIYVETKELMVKYKLNAADLGKKIRALGYDKITCRGRKWIHRDFENELLKYL